VVIESKIRGDEPSAQAEQLRRRGVEIERQEVISLGWHELIEDWWALLERGLLGPAEKVLMDDLIAFAEEHFAHLLPYTTLGRAGDNDQRRQRRLAAVMKEALPGSNIEPMRRPDLGAIVILDEPVRTTRRIALMQDGDNFALRTWLAGLKPQAQALYRTRRAQRLADFLARQEGRWQARPYGGRGAARPEAGTEPPRARVRGQCPRLRNRSVARGHVIRVRKMPLIGIADRRQCP